MHAQNDATALLAHGELDLVAIAPCVARGADRPHEAVNIVCGEVADARKRGSQVLLLGS